MFSLNTRGTGRRGRLGRLLASVFGLLTVFFVLGCPMSSGGSGDGTPPPEAKASLTGTWASPDGDRYTINGTTVTYSYSSADGSYKASYTGAIQNSPDFTASSGVIIVKYTSNQNLTTTGDYQGVYWKGLQAKAVSLANAYNSGTPSDTEKATLDKAKIEFTLDNSGKYAGMYGSYTR